MMHPPHITNSNHQMPHKFPLLVKRYIPRITASRHLIGRASRVISFAMSINLCRALEWESITVINTLQRAEEMTCRTVTDFMQEKKRTTKTFHEPSK